MKTVKVIKNEVLSDYQAVLQNSWSEKIITTQSSNRATHGHPP